MAQWSEQYSVAEFGDSQASAMAVDCLGAWAVLAGRKVLTVIDLDQLGDNVHRVTRQSKWDISCVQWNPHASHAHLFVAACNQRLDLYSWKDHNSKLTASMKAHSRNISAVDWSPFDVNVIASCSVDSFTHLWDVRDTKKPTASFQTVAGASQVKWNKVTNNCFATSHEGDVRIWDPRKGNNPVQYIAAHLSKIHGLDWSNCSEYNFATSSQDCTVKFWDYTNPRHNKGMLNSGSPVWRARYTPFGQGLITVVVPQLRRGDNNLYLWNANNLVQPVHQFVGHSDVVLEFQWRKKHEGTRDYHLVTWSKDQSLRIWKIDPQLQRLCGHDAQDSSENESTVPDNIDGTDSEQKSSELFHSPAVDIAVKGQSNQQPVSLTQEFSLVNRYIPNVSIEETNAVSRTCVVLVMNGKHRITLSITFPLNYPNGAAPDFEFTDSTVGFNIQKKLKKVLQDTSSRHVKRNTNCLEPCLRQFATAFENMTPEERRTPDSDNYMMQQPGSTLKQSYLQHMSMSAFQDQAIPFPRTCGAKFCSAGFLVCFGRSKEANKGPGFEVTPKAYSDLAQYASAARVRSSANFQSTTGLLFSRSPPTQNADFSILNFYMPIERNKRPRTKSRTYRDGPESKQKDWDKSTKNNKKSVKLDPVRIYDVSCLFTVHKQLGENYIIDTNNIPHMCQHNTNAALSVGRRDLVQLWSLVSLISSPDLKPSPSPDDGPPWARHPFGRQMLESLIQYYCGIYDVQTLAMLCCIFWSRKDASQIGMKRTVSRTSMEYVPANYNPYHTVSSMSGLLKGWTKMRKQSEETVHGPATMKVKRSNSWSTYDHEDFSFEDYKFADESDPKEKAAEIERKQHETCCRMLEPSNQHHYDQYLKAYSNILYQWGLPNQSAKVRKYISTLPESHKGIEFGVHCHHCSAEVRGAQCGTCKMQAFQCAICHTGVKGASNFCLYCGHGGHTSHMLEWFRTEKECPTGCGCQCLTGK